MGSRLYGIDLGTKNIKIYREKKGIVIDEKNVIAVENKESVIAIGNEAYEMFEKAPDNITVSFPMKEGVIADFSDMQELLHLFIAKSNAKGLNGNKEVYIAVPTDITEVEKRAFLDLVEGAKVKAKNVHIVEKPIADAVGVGIDIKSPNGVMLVDIGGDTTEITIMSLGGIVISKLIPIGGNKLDEAIIMNIKKEKNVIIGSKSAEECKMKLASAVPMEETSIEVMGRDLVNGLPVSVEVTSAMVYDAILESLCTIVDAIKMILEHTPPEISSDIIDDGIYFTGGCSKIKGLDRLIVDETHLQANIFDDSDHTVINGLGAIIEDDELKDLAFPMSQPVYE